MKIRKLTKREKIVLQLILFIGIVAGIANFIITPGLAKLKSVDREIEDRIMLLRKYSALKSKGEDILSLYKNYTNALSSGSSFEETAARLFEELESLALKSGLEIKRVKPISAEEKNRYRQVFIELELEGDFNSIFRFIDNIERQSLLIKISSFRISPQRALAKKLRCTLSLSKMVF